MVNLIDFFVSYLYIVRGLTQKKNEALSVTISV
jgi:hypothetical protein